jgi:hypothetical protein
MIRRKLFIRKVNLSPIDWKFYYSLAIAVLYATALYAFLLGIRELIRINFVAGYESWYTHETWSPLYFFNVFLAFISSTAGFAIFNNMWVFPNSRIRARIRATNFYDQVFVPGTFIYLSTKLGFAYAIIMYESAVSYYADFMDFLWMLFVIAAIVMFLQQWLTLRR